MTLPLLLAALLFFGAVSAHALFADNLGTSLAIIVTAFAIFGALYRWDQNASARRAQQQHDRNVARVFQHLSRPRESFPRPAWSSAARLSAGAAVSGIALLGTLGAPVRWSTMLATLFSLAAVLLFFIALILLCYHLDVARELRNKEQRPCESESKDNSGFDPDMLLSEIPNDFLVVVHGESLFAVALCMLLFSSVFMLGGLYELIWQRTFTPHLVLAVLLFPIALFVAILFPPVSANRSCSC